MGNWNYADVLEVIAEQIPDAPAQIQGARRISWREMNRRANGVAAALLASGVERQDKVAIYVYNGPEYLETCLAAYKAGLVPVNTNYRYSEDELAYLWDNADAIAVVFHGSFTDRAETVRSRVPKVKAWLWVDDGGAPCPDWATPYEQAAAAGTDENVGQDRRGDDDILMLYTGGTTGMPKGVMWRQHDLYVLGVGQSGWADPPDHEDLDAVRTRVQAPGPSQIPACPLMHGTGWLTAQITLAGGGCVITLESRTLDIDELLSTVEREGVAALAIVGDAFAKPMLRALDEQPGRYDLTSLVMIVSSGVMWSETTKQGLLKHHQGMLLVDAFSSSEALGMGNSVSSAAGTQKTAKFELGPNARVITEDGRDVVPGSGERGLVAIKGVNPVGYYKDEAKSAATFRMIDGERFSVPGDWAMVEADGSLTLLGRGSVCINTGGEKVFPEEVEEVLKEHPSIRDAVAVGVPDEKWGEAITAMVEPHPGVTLDEAAIIAHVKSRLAPYKAPKRVLEVATIGRAANGKVDYKRLRAEAIDRVAATT